MRFLYLIWVRPRGGPSHLAGGRLVQGDAVEEANRLADKLDEHHDVIVSQTPVMNFTDSEPLARDIYSVQGRRK